MPICKPARSIRPVTGDLTCIQRFGLHPYPFRGNPQTEFGGVMTEFEKLLAIEDIKRVKAKYFYGLDHKDWDLWRREVFSPDAKLIVPEAQVEISGLEQIIDWVSKSVADQVSVHHGHMPDIEITSEDTAVGVWAMEDRLYRTKEHPLADGSIYLHGFGHYHETYVRTPAGWRISSTRLTRLRLETRKVY